MLTLSNGLKIYLKLGSTDLRKSVDGLAVIVSDILEHDPYSGHLFVFTNRRQTTIKALYWDRSGYCLWYKRLDQSRFRWPRLSGNQLEISSRELFWLLEGLDIEQREAHPVLNYQYHY
jgi:transposase